MLIAAKWLKLQTSNLARILSRTVPRSSSSLSLIVVVLQFPRNKSVTSWRFQKSVVSVVSCRLPNSITMACCGLVGRVADIIIIIIIIMFNRRRPVKAKFHYTSFPVTSP